MSYSTSSWAEMSTHLSLSTGGQLIVTCRRRHGDDDVTAIPSCLTVDYITDVTRPCVDDLMTLDYLRVTSDNKYLLGVEKANRRLLVYTVSQHGKLTLIHVHWPTYRRVT